MLTFSSLSLNLSPFPIIDWLIFKRAMFIIVSMLTAYTSNDRLLFSSRYMAKTLTPHLKTILVDIENSSFYPISVLNKICKFFRSSGGILTYQRDDIIYSIKGSLAGVMFVRFTSLGLANKNSPRGFWLINYLSHLLARNSFLKYFLISKFDFRTSILF